VRLGSSVSISIASYFSTVKPGASPGATVIWDNQDNGTHTATSGNHDTETPDGKFDIGLVGANEMSKPVKCLLNQVPTHTSVPCTSNSYRRVTPTHQIGLQDEPHLFSI
jgi:hypothetical protein